eukprot:10107953-Prorocentrum_lima.AAC.1
MQRLLEVVQTLGSNPAAYLVAELQQLLNMAGRVEPRVEAELRNITDPFIKFLIRFPDANIDD